VRSAANLSDTTDGSAITIPRHLDCLEAGIYHSTCSKPAKRTSDFAGQYEDMTP
jgi:hypothetical protein